jgi:hypothetical protein
MHVMAAALTAVASRAESALGGCDWYQHERSLTLRASAAWSAVLIVRALRVTDDAIASLDEDSTVTRTLRAVREKYPDTALIFANGGDRSSADRISEAEVCAELGIDLRFGVGGEEKADSSTRIIAALTEDKEQERVAIDGWASRTG